MDENIIVQCTKCGAKNRIPKARLNDAPRCGACHMPLNIMSFHDRPVVVADSSFKQEVLDYPGLVIVDFWAPWCAPCRMVAPALERLASEYAGALKVAKLNVDENPVTASSYGIRSIPSLLIFRNGKLVDTLIGAMPYEQIKSRIDYHGAFHSN